MTFQALIALHLSALHNPIPIRVDRRTRATEPHQSQIYTDFASI